MNRKKVLGIVWGLLLFATIVFIFFYGLSLNQVYELIAFRIKNTILSFGMYAPVFFIIIYTLRPLIFFPSSILTLIAGFLFGPFWGIIYTIIGENMSANFAFCISRYFGSQIEYKKIWIKNLNMKIKKKGFMTTLILRLLWIPFDVVNYTLGLTKIKHKDFFLGTFLGIIPGIIIFVLLGNIFGSLKTISKEFLLLNLEISFLVFILSFIVSYYLKIKNKKLSEIKEE